MASAGFVSALGVFSVTFLFVYIFRQRSSKKGSGWLKTVPGPFGLPIVGSLLDLIKSGSRPEVLMTDWAKVYGKIFRFKVGGKSVYVLSDFDLIQRAWRHPEIQGRMKIPLIRKILGPGSGIASGTGDLWKAHRRFALSSLRQMGLGKGSFEDRISAEAGRITHSIGESQGRSVDVSYTFSIASCNVISSLVFGRQLNHEDPRLLKEVRAILDVFQGAGLGAFSTISDHLETGKKYKKANLVLKAMWDDSIRQHRAETSPSSEDVVDKYLEVLQSDLPSDHFSESNLLWFVRDLYLAGTETVSTTFRWATLLLMTHPGIQGRCREEIDSLVGRDRYPTTADMADTPYVNATISEILRIGDIAPLGVPHATTSDVNLDGYFIPEGSVVVSNVHAVMNDPNLWSEPERFRPERFLDEEGNFVKPRNLIPFGIGKRACAGEQLAKIELYVWLTRLLHRFIIAPPDDGSAIPSINEGVTGLTRAPLPYRVRFLKRQD